MQSEQIRFSLRQKISAAADETSSQLGSSKPPGRDKMSVVDGLCVYSGCGGVVKCGRTWVC